MNAGRNFVKCLECGEIIHLPDDTEDNQPQAESGTTDCSDAGGGDTPSKPGRSADWQAEFNELLGLVKEKCEAAERQFANLGHMELSGAARAYRATYEYMLSVTEAAAAK